MIWWSTLPRCGARSAAAFEEFGVIGGVRTIYSIRGRRSILRFHRFLPAILAVITDIGTAAFVRQHQPDYPIQFVTFQIVMVGAALLMAVPQRWVWLMAFLVLLAGVLLAGMSVGMFYIPTLVAAGWIMAKRLGDQTTPSCEDTKPQKGVIYTASELEAMKHRQRR